MNDPKMTQQEIEYLIEELDHFCIVYGPASYIKDCMYRATIALRQLCDEHDLQPPILTNESPQP